MDSDKIGSSSDSKPWSAPWPAQQVPIPTINSLWMPKMEMSVFHSPNVVHWRPPIHPPSTSPISSESTPDPTPEPVPVPEPPVVPEPPKKKSRTTDPAPPRPTMDDDGESRQPQKPSMSYVYMIQEILAEAPEGKLTLATIYQRIQEKYAYFRQATGAQRKSWQNSVRHNLSLNDCFVKLPKDNTKTGNDRKGHHWTLDPKYADQFEPGNTKRRRRMKRPLKQSVDDGWFTSAWGQQLVAWPHLMGATSEHVPMPADIFSATPPQMGQNAAMVGASSLVPMPTVHNGFSPPNMNASSTSYESTTSNGYFLPPAAATLANSRPTTTGPMNFYYPPSAYGATSMGSF